MIDHARQIGMVQAGEKLCFLGKAALGLGAHYQVLFDGTDTIERRVKGFVDRPISAARNWLLDLVASLQKLSFAECHALIIVIFHEETSIV